MLLSGQQSLNDKAVSRTTLSGAVSVGASNGTMSRGSGRLPRLAIHPVSGYGEPSG
jgi:hypothetical protein